MTSIRKLRIAGWIEGTTLLVLLLIAVPLKHIADMPQGVSIMGPLHGVAFIAYIRFLAEVALKSDLPPREVIQTALVSFIPLGTFYNDRFLKKREL